MRTKARRTLAFPFRAFVIVPVSVAIYGVLLHWAYSGLISPAFRYLGYTYEDPTVEVVIINWMCATAAALVLPRTFRKVSTVVLWLLYARVGATTILMAPYSGYLDDSEVMTLGVTIALIFVGIALGLKGEPRGLGMSLSGTSFWLVLVIFSLATYALLAFTQGLSLSFVSFYDVYDVRDEYSENSDSVGILRYLLLTQANVINPMFFARGIFTRRYLWVAFSIVGQLVIYSGAGYKGTLFAIPAWIVIAIILRMRKADGMMLVWGASALIAVSAIMDILLNSLLWTSLFSRRFLTTPGLLTSVYVEFFSNNPQAHLGHSILSPFVSYPYEVNPARLIGAWMANQSSQSANANLFGDGFANFGWAGMVGAGVVLWIYLRLLDRAAVGLPLMVAGVVMTMPAMAISNSSILTAMLSHGLAVGLILLAIAPRDGNLGIGEDERVTGSTAKFAPTAATSRSRT